MTKHTDITKVIHYNVLVVIRDVRKLSIIAQRRIRSLQGSD